MEVIGFKESFGPETRWCDQCGELPVEIRMKEVGVCGDCARDVFDEMLSPMLWHRICGQLFNTNSGGKAICLMPYGEEHDH